MTAPEQPAPQMVDAVWHGVDSDGSPIAVSPDGRLWWWRPDEQRAALGEWAAYPAHDGAAMLALIAWAMAERARAEKAEADATHWKNVAEALVQP